MIENGGRGKRFFFFFFFFFFFSLLGEGSCHTLAQPCPAFPAAASLRNGPRLIIPLDFK